MVSKEKSTLLLVASEAKDPIMLVVKKKSLYFGDHCNRYSLTLVVQKILGVSQ